MRFALLSFVATALLAPLAMAVAPQRSVILSWPNETPDQIVEDAKEAIRKAKGVSKSPHASLCSLYVASKYLTLTHLVTHEYNIIKGFAAQAPASALEFVTTLSDVYKVDIEEDGVITTQNDDE